MKLFKICLLLLVAAGFSACEVQGTVKDTVKGTPTNSDTVLPHKFRTHTADSLNAHENVAPVFRR